MRGQNSDRLASTLGPDEDWGGLKLTPDEKVYAYSSVVRLSTLYVARGLR